MTALTFFFLHVTLGKQQSRKALVIKFISQGSNLKALLWLAFSSRLWKGKWETRIRMKNTLEKCHCLDPPDHDVFEKWLDSMKKNCKVFLSCIFFLAVERFLCIGISVCIYGHIHTTTKCINFCYACALHPQCSNIRAQMETSVNTADHFFILKLQVCILVQTDGLLVKSRNVNRDSDQFNIN